MSRIQPGSSWTAPGAQRTTSSIQSSSKYQPYTSNNSTTKYVNRGSTSNLNSNAVTTQRNQSRQAWVNYFRGPSYLEGGTNNRLTLSLKSSIPAEIDWALNRLVVVSGSEPDLIRFHDFPGLLEGLLNLIKLFVDMRLREENEGSSNLFGAWKNEGREKIRTRATEAGMILRNLAPEKSNLRSLSDFKSLTRVITSVLEEGNGEGPEQEESAELRVYLLELLEYVAESTPLLLPGRSLGKSTYSKPELDSSPSIRLFPLLVTLTHSPDRALVLASFRCLAALSSNPISDPALSLATYNLPGLATQLPYSHPIQRAVDLLPLSDAELTIAILNFIYQHTLLPSNAALFCSRPELTHILRLVCTKLHCGQRKEVLEIVLPLDGTDAARWYESLPPKHAPIVVAPSIPLSLRLQVLDPLRSEPEPGRALKWMRTVFEANPAYEITQVALWTAYRTEFEVSDVSILPASEVIKMVTDAFPAALPMVTEVGGERKFVINGIRPRDRTDLKTVFVCRWKGCPTPICGATSPTALYSHLHHSHLSLPTPPTHCQWLHCSYVPTTSSNNPTLLANELSIHVRNHIHLYSPPPGYGTTPPLPLVEPIAIDEEEPTRLTYVRYHSEKDDSGEPTGISYLSCLILRNVARTVKVALAATSSSLTTGGGGGGDSGPIARIGSASIGALIDEGDTSIFDEFERATTEGGHLRDPIGLRLEKIDYKEVSKAGEALMRLEKKIVSVSMEDHGLGKLLGPVLMVISGLDKK